MAFPIDLDSSNHGKRLLPSLIDEIAKSDPKRVFVSFLTDRSEDIQDVDFSAFARAVSRCAWWLETSIGRGKDFETLSYIGPPDLRIAILVFAAIKAGYKVGMIR